MNTNILTTPSKELRKTLSSLLKRRDALEDSPTSGSAKQVAECSAEIQCIVDELTVRKARIDEKYKRFQWNIHHLAEDCLQAIEPGDEEALDKILEGIEQFRAQHAIATCPLCR